MLPLPQFPSKSPGGKWGISKCMPAAPGKESPCTSLPGTRTALEHPFHHLPRQGVPGYPLEQGIHPLPSILSAEGSSTRVPSLTSAAAPRSYSTRVPPRTPGPPAVLPLRLPRSRVSRACLPAGAPTWKPSATAATDIPKGRARAKRTRRLIGMQLGMQPGMQPRQRISPCR